MERIVTRPGLPYFLTESGQAWTPIGQNDAITWPELAGLFRQRDLPGVERHLRWLKDSGVTCLRLMLEYGQGEHRYLEKPAGRFVPNMVRLWDDLFDLLERVGLRVLLTPYDTFFLWIRWRHHPYNRRHGGPSACRKDWLLAPAMREAVKRRLGFASERWGASPALFAWDLWNEINPAIGRGDVGAIAPFLADVGDWLRTFERERHGFAHPQTASAFAPHLTEHPAMTEPIYRHPALDFANPHLYEKGTIDAPRDTVAPALAVGRLMRAALAEVRDGRPVFDSEHGPIHAFLDRRRTLPHAFDDEYFRHMQWAHLASGGAGGGMRWPNRHPHTLTPGMRAAQRVLADFLPSIDWTRFRRRNLSEEIACDDPDVAVFGCADEAQAVLWLLRTDTVQPDGRVAPNDQAKPAALSVPDVRPGRYDVHTTCTRSGWTDATTVVATSAGLRLTLPPITHDLAVAVRRVRLAVG